MHRNFRNDEIACGIRTTEGADRKFTCGSAPFFVRYSIGIQQTTECKERSDWNEAFAGFADNAGSEVEPNLLDSAGNP